MNQTKLLGLKVSRTFSLANIGSLGADYHRLVLQTLPIFSCSFLLTLTPINLSLTFSTGNVYETVNSPQILYSQYDF